MAVVINGTTGISGVDGSAGTPALQGGDPDTGIFYGTNTVSIATNGVAAVTVDATGSTTFAAQTLFPDGTVSAPSISNTGDVNTGVYFPAADNVAIATGGVAALTADSSQNVSVTNTLVMGSSFKRNRIINGDMRVDQRNAGAAISAATLANFGYTVDRFGFFASQSAKFSFQQNAGSVTPPIGFTNYAGLTVASAYSVTASDYFWYFTKIEGLNISDLAWGTANAKTVTLSFWVYSSLTGTFGGALQNNAQTWSYPFSYSISQANTWTQISVTIAGPNASQGTWLTTNGIGIILIFGLGAGSSQSNTANAWANGAYTQPTSTVSVVGTNGATFYITGVQLEVGSVATPYERQIYSEQLAQCQRYYFKTFADGTAPAQNAGTTGSYILPQMVGASTTQNGVTMAMPVAMRAMTTVTLYNPSAANAQIRNTSVNADCSSSAVTAIGGSGYSWGVSPSCVTAAGSAAGNQMRIHFTVDGEL